MKMPKCQSCPIACGLIFDGKAYTCGKCLLEELARERERHQWMPIEHDTKFTADMEVGRWMGPKWVITRMEGDSDGWVYIQPNDFFTHYRMLNPPALLEPAPVATGEDSQ